VPLWYNTRMAHSFATDLLFSTTKQRLLRALFSEGHDFPGLAYAELLRATAAGAGGFHRELRKFVRAGLIRERREHGRKLYLANTDHPYYPALSALARDMGTGRQPENSAAAVRGIIPKSDTIFRKIDALRALAAANGVQRLRLFGSVARGTADDKSDLDFLVDLAPDRTLLDLVELKTELSQLFDRPVDVVTEHGLKPGLRKAVLRDAVQVLP
jgi:predicted nucleotidyltransferase